MTEASPNPGPEGRDIKTCCARMYESEIVRLLLGESFHPGGVKLTSRLGQLMGLSPKHRVLDVASGQGTSALHLAREFGCEVVGIDLSVDNVDRANRAANEQLLSDQVRFIQGDSESLAFENGSFDAIVCECAFCTFPDKPKAAAEFYRVVRSGGQVALSDVTRSETLSGELTGLMSWIACIADARPLHGYEDLLNQAGFRIIASESHDQSLIEMVDQIRARLFGLEIAVGLKKLDLPGIDLSAAKQMAVAAATAIRRQQLGYALVQALKRGSTNRRD